MDPNRRVRQGMMLPGRLKRLTRWVQMNSWPSARLSARNPYFVSTMVQEPLKKPPVGWLIAMTLPLLNKAKDGLRMGMPSLTMSSIGVSASSKPCGQLIRPSSWSRSAITHTARTKTTPPRYGTRRCSPKPGTKLTLFHGTFTNLILKDGRICQIHMNCSNLYVPHHWILKLSATPLNKK